MTHIRKINDQNMGVPIENEAERCYVEPCGQCQYVYSCPCDPELPVCKQNDIC